MAGSEDVVLLSPARLDVFLRLILSILAAALLLIPVLILSRTRPTSPAQGGQSAAAQILIVFMFTLLFSAACSVVTKAKRGEVLIATVGYCAVLVVFMGSASNEGAAAAIG